MGLKCDEGFGAVSVTFSISTYNFGQEVVKECFTGLSRVGYILFIYTISYSVDLTAINPNIVPVFV